MVRTLATRRSNRVSGTKEKGTLERGSNVAELETTTTETEDDDSKTEEEEKELEEFGNADNGKESVQDSRSNCEPIDMEIEIGSGKDSSLSSIGLPGTITKKQSGLVLSVIQKSRLSNWAEHHFLRANKIMSFDEAANDTKLHKAICKAVGIEESDWAHVGAEAIRKLRSAMSDRVSLHRKIVKGLYFGKFLIGE
jgi:hypothetical protein